MIEIKCDTPIVMVPIGELKPNPRNPNKHDAEQIDRIATLIKGNGFRRPIVVSNRCGLMTVGHGRLMAAQKLGMTHVPVSFQDYADDGLEYADMVADNASTEGSHLDLAQIHVDLPELAPFPIELMGFADFQFEPNPNENDADAVPEPPKVAKTRRGELWLLGEHRLLIDDCTVKENVERLMGGEKADMVFTDPPYNVASESTCFDATSETRKNSMKALRDSEWDKNFDISKLFPSFETILAKDCSVYVCTSHWLVQKIWDWMGAFLEYSHYCVWNKVNPMPSLSKRRWTWNSEMVCYGTRGKHIFNFPAEGHAYSVWTFTKSSKCDLHPTMKPTSIPEHAISHSSNPGQIVADLFLGSGSTLIACEKTGRRCFGMEIAPEYGTVIVERWMKYTGKMAYREDGKSWDEVKNG